MIRKDYASIGAEEARQLANSIGEALTHANGFMKELRRMQRNTQAANP